MKRPSRGRPASSAPRASASRESPSREASSREPALRERLLAWEARLLPALLAALAVALPLVPTESVGQGTGALGQLLVLLGLGLWISGRILRGRAGLVGGAVDLLLALFLTWYTLSAVRMAAAGDARQSLNVTWAWIGGGVIWFLVRQTLISPQAIRALLAVQLGLAVGLSTYGFYQSLYVMPRDRAAFAQDPDAVLRAAGVVAPPGSPLREQYRNRLESREPLATFALTNSLAGYLLPALVLAAGLLTQGTSGRLTRPTLVTLAVATCVVAACLLLTKSRSAYVAALGALLVFGLAAIRGRIRLGWLPFPLALGTLLLLIGAATVTGYLDVEVLSEARKSLGYRWEYWQATLAMLRDFPLFGCGPGNFQQFYAAYKLPQSSEVVADPHNLAFEIAATAGWPALLLWCAALGAWCLTLVRTFVSRGPDSAAATGTDTPDAPDMPPATTPTASPASATEPAPATEVRSIFAGAAFGLVFGALTGLLAGFPLPSIFWLVAVVPGVAVVSGLRHWVSEGELPVGWMALAVLALLVNLLAAGGIGFPAVALGWWLLAALTLNTVSSNVVARPAPPWFWGVAAASWLLLVAAFYFTCYRPVFGSSLYRAEGEEAVLRDDQRTAEAAFLAWAAVDPWSGEPWRRLAELRQRAWLASRSSESHDAFVAAALTAVQRQPRSHVVRRELGDLLLAAFRATGDRSALVDSIALYRDGVTLYPQQAMGHAQLAWALWVAGEQESSRTEAKLALTLDDLHAHREQKLERQQLVDFPPGTGVPTQVSTRPDGLNARECLRQVILGERGTSPPGSTPPDRALQNAP